MVGRFVFQIDVQGGCIREEQQLDLAAFGRLSVLHELVDVRVTREIDAGLPPGTGLGAVAVGDLQGHQHLMGGVSCGHERSSRKPN